MNEELQFNIEKFFKSYGPALNSFSASEIATYYKFPCLILDDDATYAFNDEKGLNIAIQEACKFYKKLKVANVVPKITSINVLTKNIMIASIDWSYFNADYKLLYKCECEYTLSVKDYSTIHIAVVISLNEKEKISELMDVEEIEKL